MPPLANAPRPCCPALFESANFETVTQVIEQCLCIIRLLAADVVHICNVKCLQRYILIGLIRCKDIISLLSHLRLALTQLDGYMGFQNVPIRFRHFKFRQIVFLPQSRKDGFKHFAPGLGFATTFLLLDGLLEASVDNISFREGDADGTWK